MNHLQRLLIIALCIASSIIIVQISKAPDHMDYKGYRVACMPLENVAQQAADKQLIPYSQIAHTPTDQHHEQPHYRCYFRFAPADVVCTPPSHGTKQATVYCAQFPQINSVTNNQCYVLNPKLKALTGNLKKQPPVPLDSYLISPKNIVNSWQEVRDILLLPNANEL